MRMTFTVGFDVCGLMLISSIILQGRNGRIVLLVLHGV